MSDAVVVETLQRFTGVYHAAGGLLGELSYVVGKVRGTAHCGLCDITHRGIGPKQAWKALTADLAAAGTPMNIVHLNERTPEIAAASEGQTPCVLAHTATRLVLLLGPADLDVLGGDVELFSSALRRAVDAQGMAWGSDVPS
jgi:hypothetical protein